MAQSASPLLQNHKSRSHSSNFANNHQALDKLRNDKKSRQSRVTLGQAVACLVLVSLICAIGPHILDVRAASQAQTDAADRFVNSLKQSLEALKNFAVGKSTPKNDDGLQPLQYFPRQQLVAASNIGDVKGNRIIKELRKFQEATINATAASFGDKQSQAQPAPQARGSSGEPQPLPPFPAGLCCEVDADFLPVSQSQWKAPGLVGLGTHKAGTTFLWSVLRESPYLQQADGKELYFLAQYPLAPDAFAEYLTRWPQRPPTAKAPDYVNFEYTATYLQHPIAGCRLRKLLPDTKFVVSFRDPVDRAVSHYNMFLDRTNTGQMSKRPLTFMQLMEKEKQHMEEKGCDMTEEAGLTFTDCFRCQHLQPNWVDEHGTGGDRLAENCKDLNLTEDDDMKGTPCYKHLTSLKLLQYGIYEAPLRAWLQLFPKDRFLFLSSDEIHTDPVGVVNRVHGLLGKPADFTKRQLEAAEKLSNVVEVKRFGPEDREWGPAQELMKKFFAPHVAKFYALMDELGVDFPPFKRWPKGFDVDKVVAGDFSELVEP